MTRTDYKQVTDGDVIHPTKSWTVRCCDCGLVHEFKFSRLVDVRVTMKPRATAASRRSIRYKCKPRKRT